MMVLAWIAQIVLFFILWRLVHMAAGLLAPKGFVVIAQLILNLLVAIVLLIVVSTCHNAWWLMPILGALIGVLTGASARRVTQTD